MAINITEKQTHTWEPDFWGNLEQPKEERFSIEFREVPPTKSIALSSLVAAVQAGEAEAMQEMLGVYEEHIVKINNLFETVNGEQVAVTNAQRFLELCGPQLFNALCAAMAHPVSEDELKNSEAPSSGS